MERRGRIAGDEGLSRSTAESCSEHASWSTERHSQQSSPLSPCVLAVQSVSRPITAASGGGSCYACLPHPPLAAEGAEGQSVGSALDAVERWPWSGSAPALSSAQLSSALAHTAGAGLAGGHYHYPIRPLSTSHRPSALPRSLRPNRVPIAPVHATAPLSTRMMHGEGIADRPARCSIQRPHRECARARTAHTAWAHTAAHTGAAAWNVSWS